ncbi:hypothetical protein H5410_027826 [Solanum commersonii]|uniref:Uncharacterized protein n=1 Tax=Solanum commersonii TaxID=4109 RepID=A0A9J5Z5M9_SOLCO|nr:hypothetical protein H5410_027826 [Solanum commersonii]
MDTTWQEGTKRLKRTKKGRPEGRRPQLASRRLSGDRKYQVGDEMEQSACHRVVPQSSTISPNDSKHDEAEG